MQLIRHFGRRDCINHVHFGNACAAVPQLKYIKSSSTVEVDMLAAMRVFHEIGYSRMMMGPGPLDGGDRGTRTVLGLGAMPSAA